MTTRRGQRANMAAAAAVRTTPEARPAGQTAVRTKPLRITVDLEPAEARELERWISSAAETINPDWPRLTKMDAIRAMIRATVTDPVIGGVVVDLLRRDQGTTR